MSLVAISFFVGILISAYGAKLYSLILLSIISGIAFIVSVLSKSLIRKILVCILCSFLGTWWFTFHAGEILNHRLPVQLIGKTLNVQAEITSIPQIVNQLATFNATVALVNSKEKYTARLTWLKPMDLHKGQVWQMQVRLKPPHGLINPGGFDYEQWLLSRHIQSVGYVVGSSNSILIKANSKFNIDYWREKIAAQIHISLTGNDTVGIVQALIVGMQQNITDEQWQIMRNTGTNHLVAVAGLHIGFIALFVFKLVRMSIRLIPQVTLYVTATQISGVIALICCFAYAELAGMGLPTKRALMMSSVFLLALLLQRSLPRWHTYFLALFILLIYDPLCVLEMSFWLSFGAVAIILFAMHDSQRRKNHVWQWLYLQWVIMLGLLPLSLLFFHQFAPLSCIANLIAILVVGFLVLPLVVIGTLFLKIILGKILLVFAADILHFLWIILAWFSKQNWTIWQPSLPPLVYLLFAMIGITFLIMPSGFPLRKLSVLWLLPIVFFQPERPDWGEAQVSVLDVGQGLSIVIVTNKHTLLYDTGPKYGDSDAGERVIVPFLLANNIKTIDRLIVSHNDMDHAGGIASINSALRISQVLGSEPSNLNSAKRALQCLVGENWEWDGVRFEMLYPYPDQLGQENNSSCVLRVTAGGKQVLLTGDIEARAETHLLKNGVDLSADVLIAPHHGSKTSSTEAFLTAVDPRFVIISAGFYNRFRQPHTSIIERYKRHRLSIYETSKGGAISFTLSPSQTIQIGQERKLHPRLWFGD